MSPRATKTEGLPLEGLRRAMRAAAARLDRVVGRPLRPAAAVARPRPALRLLRGGARR
jgi:hypothetical protein